MARVLPRSRRELLAQLSGHLRPGLRITRTEQGTDLGLRTASPTVARTLYRIIKALLPVRPRLIVRRNSRGGLRALLLHIPDPVATEHLLREAGPDAPLTLPDQKARQAFLRGLFLSAGYVSDPRTAYHLELQLPPQGAEETAHLLSSLHIAPLLLPREKRGMVAVYLKESEAIVRLLTLMGATSAVLHFENVRSLRSLREQVNRMVNMETANLDKSIRSGLQQAERIATLQGSRGLGHLPESLRVVAEARLRHPEASLSELGRILGLGKSGVAHRMRRLMALAPSD